ncbi:MAG: PatB family C-S lyase [Clostridiales bacterium]|nr:PatB family C-S lyase [Clostridiales bacterium]
MKYNFDEIIDRKNTNSLNTDGFRQYIFHDDGSMKFPFADDEFVRMWVADMEFATPQVIIDGVKERLDRRIFGYTQLFDPSYYEAFKGWTDSRYGWHCQKEHLVSSNGVVPALYELAGYITKPEEKVLILTPSYPYFKYAADTNGRECVCCDLINEDGYYGIDFADFENKAGDEKVTLCIFCNPHNPSGRVWSQEELKRVGDICIQNGLWLISDEIHCDILRIGKTHTPMAKLFPDYDKLITCMAASKTFNMAGFMFSNIIIPNDNLRAVWKEKHYSYDNPLSIAASQSAYLYGADWLDQMRVYLDGNYQFVADFLAENLPKAKFRISEATYLAWVGLGSYLDGVENIPLFFANEAGVLLEGGNMFVQNSDGYIRLNLACPRSMVEEGLKRISKVLNR